MISSHTPSPLVAVASGALPGWDLEAVLDAVAEAGVDALEVAIGPSGLLPAGDIDAALDLKRRLAETGVLVCGVDATVEITFADGDAAKVIQSAHAIGAAFVRFFAPPFSTTQSLEDQLESAQQALSDLTSGAQSMRPPVKILVEIAPKTLAASPELARRLIRDAITVGDRGDDGPGVIFDPGNMVAEGHLHPTFAVALLGDLLQHVHVKNRLMVQVDGLWTATSQSLLSGRVDWPSTIDALHRSGYRGAYTLDHLSGPTSVDSLKADISELRQVLAATLESEPTI